MWRRCELGQERGGAVAAGEAQAVAWVCYGWRGRGGAIGGAGGGTGGMAVGMSSAIWAWRGGS